MYSSINRKGTCQVPAKVNDDAISKESSKADLSDHTTVRKRDAATSIELLTKMCQELEERLGQECDRSNGLEQRLNECRVHLTVMQRVNDDLAARDDNSQTLELLYEKVIEMEQEYLKAQTKHEQREKELLDQIDSWGMNSKHHNQLDYLCRLENVLGENGELNSLITQLKAEGASKQLLIEEVTQLKHSHSINLKSMQMEQRSSLERIDELKRSNEQIRTQLDEQTRRHHSQVSQLETEMQQLTTFYNESLTQCHQLQRRIEQCLQLINTQETQFVAQEQQLRQQIQTLEEKLASSLKEKAETDQRVKDFKNKIDLIDQIDSRLKRALEEIELDNVNIKAENARLERQIKNELSKLEQKDVQIKHIAKQLEASEVIQVRQNHLVTQKTQQIEHMISVHSQSKGHKNTLAIVLKQLEQHFEEFDSLLTSIFLEEPKCKPLYQRKMALSTEIKRSLQQLSDEVLR